MFLGSYKKGLGRRQCPCLLYGYGGTNLSLTPRSASPTSPGWRGRRVRPAEPRGGSEYGEAWHKAGTKLQKQNVFDDFIAAAEQADRRNARPRPGWRSPAGPTAACSWARHDQRPELHGGSAGESACSTCSGSTSSSATPGPRTTRSSDDPEQFVALKKYSPLHNLKPGTCYPPTLVITADHDDRVVPAHSFKFAATLQEAQSCANPVLIRIETRAGHGAGKPTAKQIEEVADTLGFLVKALKIDYRPAGTP
ncbi:MAG: prolyl oligopeptidase family serine peptidase [Isosphaeraceae bacterium]